MFPWYLALGPFLSVHNPSECPRQSTCSPGLSLTAYLLVFNQLHVSSTRADQTSGGLSISTGKDLNSNLVIRRARNLCGVGGLMEILGNRKPPPTIPCSAFDRHLAYLVHYCVWHIIGAQKCCISEWVIGYAGSSTISSVRKVRARCTASQKDLEYLKILPA